MNLTRTLPRIGRSHRSAANVAAILALSALGSGSALAFRVRATPTVSQDESTTPHPIRVSGGVMARYIETRVEPVYPPDAKAAGIQGAVVLHALIGKDGRIASLSVVSGNPALAQSAIEAVSKWVYKPFFLNGEPTVVDTIITVNFPSDNQ